MHVYEKRMELPIRGYRWPGFGTLEDLVCETLGDNEVPIRFAVTETSESNWTVEVSLLCDYDQVGPGTLESVFHFRQRSCVASETFNVALVIPTGIGAEIGGHAGDAGPVTKLLSVVCDSLITHPNAVNASDINELPENGLYVEGSILARLMMGTVGLQRVRSNRVLVVIDDHVESVFVHAAENAVNAARAAYGLSCTEIVRLNPPVVLISEYSDSGRAVGSVSGLDRVLTLLTNCRDDFDAVALSSVIRVPSDYHQEYFDREGEMVNPWGGVEAMLTHAISSVMNIPSAHSPMFESHRIANVDPGTVEPRMAAEAISLTFLQCILKGLQRSPRLVTDPTGLLHSDVLDASDVSCLIIPEGCLGIPTLAALDQGIPVVTVRENTNLMKNDLSRLNWRQGQLIKVNNYWEAAGVVCALRAGISPEAVRRPMIRTPSRTYAVHGDSRDLPGRKTQRPRSPSIETKESERVLE